MVSLESSLLNEGLGEPYTLLIFPYCTFQSGSGAESSGPQCGAIVPLIHPKAPLWVLSCEKDERVGWTEKGRRGMREENGGGLTVDVENVVSLVAAQVADGRAAIGATVTLVEEREDQGTLLGDLQGWHTALLLPQVLLGAVESSEESRSGSQRETKGTEQGSQGLFDESSRGYRGQRRRAAQRQGEGELLGFLLGSTGNPGAAPPLCWCFAVETEHGC